MSIQNLNNPIVICRWDNNTNPLLLIEMLHKGTFFNLQSTELPEWSGARCVRSELTEYNTKKATSELSLKLVKNGEEHYCVDGFNYKLKANDLLLVNSGESIETIVDSKNTTTGICIFPPESLVSEAIHSTTRSWDEALDRNVQSGKARITTHMFRMESAKNTAQYIKNQLPWLEDGSIKSNSWWLEFYVALAENIASDQRGVAQKISRIQAIKMQTREEHYRRLSMAREYIHDHRFESISIDELANLTMMSKFHFLRSFKAMFNTTPYGYLLELKLAAAREFLEKGYSLKETAALVGYSDPKNLRKQLL